MKYIAPTFIILSSTAHTAWSQSSLRGGSRDLQAFQVTTLQLIKASNGEVIADLAPNSSIDISAVGSGLSINAVVSGTVGSVKFSFGNNANFQTESVAPYAMCGDINGVFKSCPGLVAGTHTVVATPFSEGGGSGSSGGTKTVTFTLVNGPATSPVPVPPAPVPTPAPITAPVPAPVPVPVQAPVPVPPAPSSCKVPKFVGGWQGTSKYPIPAAEAQGAVIGDDFVVISGFTMGYGQATAKNYALSLQNPNGNWKALDDLPVSQGITHGAFAVVGTKLYMCGGYLGGHPGPHISTCLVYDHSIAPGSGKQWKSFPSLPDGRAGGGMVYDPTRNALIFAGGAERPKAGNPDAVDYQHAWMFEFNNPGWKELPDIPFLSNHMSYVSTTDASGKVRHFFVGGQIGENEYTGNIKVNYEWDAIGEAWVKRADMPFTRGHASSSTNAVPCGYIIAGGSTNEFGKTKDISYYDIGSNSWTKIGELPSAINTPVCGIDFERGMYYCETGWANGKFSTKRQIEI